MPLISVIVPVYNGEKTIQETIDSVLNQTWSDLELIIINDGSQDSTLDILSRVEDSRVKVFSYSNAGQAASRNRGLGHASGEYIAFLDADDLWTSDKLESQLRALQESSQAFVAYSWTDYIDESGQFIRRGNHITVNGEVYATLLLTDFLENGSSILIRRQALDAVGGFDESLPPAEDWDLWLRLARQHHFVVIPRSQILYRVSAASASANVWKMEASCLRVIERAFGEAPASLQYLKKYSIANLYKYLTFKALEQPSEPKRGLAALRFFLQVIKNEPVMLRSPISLKVLFKSAVVTLLPPQQSQIVLNKLASLFNTTTLLGYIKIDLP